MKARDHERWLERSTVLLLGASFLFTWNFGISLGLANQHAEEPPHAESELHTMDVQPGTLLYSAVEIRGSADFHPDDTHGGVVWRDAEGVILLYLRSAGDSEDKFERARAVSRALNEMLLIGHPPNFEVVQEEGEVVILGGVESTHPHRIVTVTRGDVLGYQYRAPGGRYHDPSATRGLDLKAVQGIDRMLVAGWWAANLEDQIAMMLGSEEPHHTEGTFAGEIYHGLIRKARARFRGEHLELPQWVEVIHDLTPEEKKNLAMASQFIPANFGGGHRAGGD